MKNLLLLTVLATASVSIKAQDYDKVRHNGLNLYKGISCETVEDFVEKINIDLKNKFIVTCEENVEETHPERPNYNVAVTLTAEGKKLCDTDIIIREKVEVKKSRLRNSSEELNILNYIFSDNGVALSWSRTGGFNGFTHSYYETVDSLQYPACI